MSKNLLKGNLEDSDGHFLTTLYDGDNPEQFFEPSGASVFDDNLLNPGYFPQERDTCGYWTAFFCAEAIKYDSIQEVKGNFDEILLKTAAKVSKFIDKKPAILCDEPEGSSKFLYKPYNYASGNPPQTKTVFILDDFDPNMKSQCVNLDVIRTMLNSKYKQPTIKRRHSIA